MACHRELQSRAVVVLYSFLAQKKEETLKAWLAVQLALLEK